MGKHKKRRNAACPCRSGKRHKNCCHIENVIRKRKKKEKREGRETEAEKKPFLARFKKSDRIKLFAGLQTHSQNHGKFLRLEELVEESIESQLEGTEPLDYTQMNAFLSKNYSSYDMEDPPVNLFTELITYHGGDYLVFSGDIEWGRYILQNMLNAFHYPSLSVPDRFRMDCAHVILLLLKISDTIVKRIGYERYFDATVESKRIHVPRGEESLKHFNAVVFTKSELDSMASPFGISLDLLDLFVCPDNPSSHRNSFSGESILLDKPFCWCDDELVVVSPCSIIYAISRFIWRAAEVHGCLVAYNEAYHEILLQNNMMDLIVMGWRPISMNGLPIATGNLPIKERFLKFDDDKIAYLTFRYNNRQNANLDVGERQKEVVSWLNTKVNGFQIFNLNVFAVTGENRFLLAGNIDGCLTTIILSPELEIISQYSEHNNLTLWKFAQARNELGEVLFTINTIDSYFMYKSNDQSFYVSDDRRPDFMVVSVGDSGAFQKNVVKKRDLHCITQVKEGGIACVPCVSRRDSTRTYYPPASLGVKLEQVVVGFSMPIWVESLCDINEEEMELKMFYPELNEAICYWLWQMQSSIMDRIQELGEIPITIQYELLEKEKWTDLSEFRGERVSNVESLFDIDIHNRNIIIKIPFELAPHLYGVDNGGERSLLRVLLRAFNLFASKKNITELFSQQKIEEVVENAAPLGLKKKVFMLDTSADLRLDPSGLIPHRNVQHHDVNVVLDEVLSKLDKLPELTSESSKKDRSQFIVKIVTKALLPWLKEELSKYDSKDLLKRLLALNESAINRREHQRLLTPLKIACFVSEEEQMKAMHNELIDLDITSTSLRCLIEHLGAERYVGTGIISDGRIDLLVAIMSKIITWGMIGDFIHLGLVDINLSVLLSGRLGTNFHKVAQPLLEAYKLSKVEEDVTDAESYTQSVFEFDNKVENESGSSIPEGIENGFKEVYGLTLTDYNSFMYWAYSGVKCSS